MGALVGAESHIPFFSAQRAILHSVSPTLVFYPLHRAIDAEKQKK